MMKGSPPVSPSPPYHHGDLRAALLSSALELLRSEGPSALTLRAIARAAGVSESAPYRHFPSRASLIAAVAEDGFQRLRISMLDAARTPLAPGSTERAALQALGLAYVRFGIEHPAEYSLMFGPELAAIDAETLPPSYIAESRGTLALLEQGILALQQRGKIRAGSAATMATCAWATMHGLVMLALEGQIDASDDELLEMAKNATVILMTGMTSGG